MQRLRIRSVLLVLGASLGGFLAATAAGAEAPATTPATQAATEPAPHDAAFFDQMMQRLKLAAAARHDLHALTPADEDALNRLAEETADPDIRALLQARIEELDEERSLNPEPLSLEFKDTAFADVLLKLGNATGVTFQTWGGGGSVATFTLSAHREPFWQIFTELSRQHPLMMQRSDRPQIMQANGGGGMTRCVLLPPGFAIFPMTIRRSSDVNIQSNPDTKASEQMRFTYIVAADPRMKVVHMLPTVFTSIRDDAGNNLLPGDSDQAGYASYNSNQQIVFESSVGLALPAKRGKTIVSAKGEVHAVVAMGEDRIDVDPAKSLNKPITVGAYSATIAQFKVQNNNIQFNIQSSGQGGSQGNLTVAFVDANDQTVWSTCLYGDCGGSAGGNFVEPVKVRFSTPHAIKTLTIPFELKDLPLP